MKNIHILIIFLCITASLFSQKYAGKWALGCGGCQPPNDGGATVDFTQDSAIASLAFRNMSLLTNAGICDKNGDFLFYTNSYWISNKNNDTMLNGAGLYHSNSALGYASQGGAAPQGAIVLPIPNDTNQYYLFHQTFSNYNNTYTPNTLVMNKIDMRQDSGRGAIVIKNVIISEKEERLFPYGQMTACKHANGKDWWLFLPKYQSEYYYRFRVTQYGITGPDSQAIAWDIPATDSGQGVFSPDGSKYTRFTWGFDGRLLVFDFDRCKGLLSNKREVIIADNDSLGGFGGCAFSPNSRFVYVADIMHVHQFDTEAADLALSDSIVMIYDGFLGPGQANFGYSLLAENKSIYFSTAGATHFLHQIKYPDSLGMKCQPILRAVDFFKGGRGLPNYPYYNLGASATPCYGVAIEEPVEHLQISPNPTQTSIFISSPKGEMKILNSLGQEIYRKKIDNPHKETEISFANFPKGIYYLQVQTEDKVYTEKIIKE